MKFKFAYTRYGDFIGICDTIIIAHDKYVRYSCLRYGHSHAI